MKLGKMIGGAVLTVSLVAGGAVGVAFAANADDAPPPDSTSLVEGSTPTDSNTAPLEGAGESASEAGPSAPEQAPPAEPQSEPQSTSESASTEPEQGPAPESNTVQQTVTEQESTQPENKSQNNSQGNDKGEDKGKSEDKPKDKDEPKVVEPGPVSGQIGDLVCVGQVPTVNVSVTAEVIKHAPVWKAYVLFNGVYVVNGVPLEDGSFSETLTLVLGENDITLAADYEGSGGSSGLGDRQFTVTQETCGVTPPPHPEKVYAKVVRKAFESTSPDANTVTVVEKECVEYFNKITGEVVTGDVLIPKQGLKVDARSTCEGVKVKGGPWYFVYLPDSKTEKKPDKFLDCEAKAWFKQWFVREIVFVIDKHGKVEKREGDWRAHGEPVFWRDATEKELKKHDCPVEPTPTPTPTDTTPTPTPTDTTPPTEPTPTPTETAGPGPVQTQPPTNNVSSQQGLATTGADVTPWIIIGGLALAAGAGAFVWDRRRRLAKAEVQD